MKFLFLIITFSSLISNSFSHPDHGELLCFEATNFDIGESYINDKNRADFVFVNCSHDTVVIDHIISTNNDRPYSWDGKLSQKIILPGQRDTLRFYRSPYFREAGLYDQSFTVSYQNSEVRQYLNIFCELNHNRGHIEATSLVLDTVDRGDQINFQLLLKNTGLDPILISPRYYNQKNPLIYLDSFPIIINPRDCTNLHFLLNTDNLCRDYKKYISFYSNEDTDNYRNTFNISYTGFLNTVGEAGIKFDSLVRTKYINKGDACIFTFPFTNTGDVPLLITYAKTSCGCLVASWPKQPIPPGESEEIIVKYDSKRIGPINKSITVLTNACEEKKVLRVKGYVRPID